MDNEKTDSNLTAVEEIINDKIDLGGTENTSNPELIANKDVHILSSGNALRIEELYGITAAEDTRIIILVGPTKCGKTTIETTIYQLFHNNIVGDFFFAGSKTIQAYESRLFNTRIESKRDIPMTPRTSQGEREIFLHLRVYNGKTAKYMNLFFADLSGEEFENNRADTNSMKKNLDFIKCADYVIAVFDGELISKKKTRNSTYSSIAMTLKTMSEAGLFSSKTTLQTIISKYDIVSKRINALDDEPEDIAAFINDIKTRLEQLICQPILNYNIAAMPPNGNADCRMGYGLQEIMESWCIRKQTRNFSSYVVTVPRLNSEFNKLQRKLLGDADE